MSLSDVVVKGEAIESDVDSDLEHDQQSGQIVINDTSVEYKGTVFSGEAPESDDEILAFSNVKLCEAKEVTETFKPSTSKSSNKHKAELSLLQQCLVDRNHLLWAHLNQCVQNTVTSMSSQVISTEQLLIQSQIKIQAATQQMKQASDASDQIVTKLNNILTSDFLPDITIPTNT